MSQVLELIKKRRTTRAYKSEQIKDEELNQILEAGLWAPSGHNMQPWHFVVIQNQEVIDGLNIDTKKVMEGFHIEEFRKWGTNEKFNIFYNAPTVILAMYDEKGLTPVQDISAATQNMLLMAEGLEVGACWNGMVCIGFGDEGMSKKYAEKLNLPEGHRVNHAIILGYAKTEILRGPERKENKVTFIR